MQLKYTKISILFQNEPIYMFNQLTPIRLVTCKFNNQILLPLWVN